MLVHGVSLSLRFWQARHPPRYAAYLIPSSPSFPHSSDLAAHRHFGDNPWSPDRGAVAKHAHVRALCRTALR
ncbi:hypothetical protein BJS_08733 [Bradyrhizobium japonicum SEMIA 5079]|nr:hypothetical protein BJS_08733 [Bradyrhizobium japonicum SEMIA 5079]